MVHKTRSGKKINVDKANGNGSSSSGMGKMDRLGFRKSAQEIPSRTSKSKLLEKQPPPTPCTQIKSRRPEKLNTLSPLRTPDRDKSHILSCSLVSKLSEEELNLSATKKEKSVKQVTMESEKVSTSGNQNICLKRKRIDGRSFRSLFKMQRRRDAIPAIDEVSQIPNESPRLSSDSKLVGDKVIGGGDCHREVAEEYSEDHAAQADEVDSLSSSEGLNIGNLHTDGEAELSHANHIHSLASEPIVALPEGDSLKGSINGCTISKTLDETESLPEGCSTATKNLPDLIGSTPTSSRFNSQNGEHSIQRKAADCQIVCGLVYMTTQSTLAEHDKHCFTGSCGVCLKRKRLDHDSPKVDLCTCVAMPKMDFGNKANHKDRVGDESTVILGSAERHCGGQSEGANMDSQVDNHKNVCAMCKQGGKSLLCYGEGCRRCYHLSCLGPNLDDIPSGVWHCLWCVKKKIKYGVHSVSNGIESIWEAREVEEVSGAKGTQRQKQYLVKYQGLAHVHNHWLPEAQLVIEAPSILEDFKHKDLGLRWNSEWTKPQCLLKKRWLFFSKLHGGEQILDAGDKLDCKCEWLVMWQGLDVESATWELENADFLCSSHGLSLIKEYEICQGKQNMMFSQLAASDNRLELSKFIEYWLPVQVSNLQLEQYCNTLLANINALCSHSKKSDPVGVLNEVLLAVRKCCVHPYILDPTVVPLNKGLSPSEILDVGIKASGKLHLLDKMLSEMKSQHLRVVIFYQSIGPVATLGNILDDFLRGRFGDSSYERVESTSLNTSKRQAALNRFRQEESGLFVLLLEKRICNTSIKLSSVDGVIIYDGDSNPQNDLRLLQKLSFVSQSKPIRVFRLYSCYTVEEQALVITKQNPNADNLQSLNRNVKNTLMWGASHLFSRLDEYHASDSQASALDISCGQLLLNDVFKEFCAIISQNSEINDIHNSVISKVLKSSGPCITDIPLFGEQKFKYTCGEEPQVFWKKLLEGRNPRWRHISGPTPRNRKRVQYFEDSPCSPEVGNDDAGKKRRKTVNSSVDAISTLPVSEGSQPAALNEGPSTIKAANQSLPTSTACQNSAHIGDHASNSSCSLSHEVNVEPVERVALPDEQKSLHIYLKVEMAKVFEVLKLSDDIKHMVGIFLDFIMENHRVSREPATLLQALEISLCRVAASLLKQKLDENEMLMLTKEHLGFECTEDEATNVYWKLRSLKKVFLQHLEKNEITSRHSEPALVLSKGMENVTKGNVVAQQTTTLKDKVVESETEKMIKKVQSKCDMRMSRLKEKQQEEIENFKKDCEEKRVAIEKHYRVQFAIVRAVHCETPLAKNNFKNLNNWFSREIEELNCHKDFKMKEFEQKHNKEINEEIQNTAFWVSKAELCSTEDAVTNLHLYASDSRDDIEYLQDSVDAGNNISDSRDGTGDQDIADIDNNSISNSREDNGNLQDIEDDNREISDSRDDVRNLQDIADVNDNPTNVASRDDIGNLEDNVDINNHNNNNSNPANVASADDIGHIQDNADVNDPPGVASVSECHLEENEPINILNESESSMVPSSVPTTTTDEVQSKGVSSATVSEKPMATISPAEALVSSLNQPNEVGNIDDHCEDTVPVVPLTSEKHTIDESSLGEHANGFSIEVHECARTEDVIHNHPSEVHGIAHNGVLRHEHSAGASITTMVKKCTPANNTDFLNNDGNENVIAHKSIDGNSTSQEQLLVTLPSLQAGACSDDNGLLLQTQDQVPQDQCSPHLASNELQFNQGQLSEFEAGSPRVDDARRVTQSNCESILIGNSEPQQLPSGGSQPPPGEAAYESPNHESNDLHCSETSPQLAEVETAVEPLCNADSQGRVSSELHASVHLPNMTLDCSPTDSSVSRIDCQLSGDLHCYSENTQTLPHEVRITSELPNQAILQPLNLTSIQGPNDMRMHHAHFMPSLNSPIRMLVNPLSKELERIHKEIEQAVKSHEDWKLQQRSDCEKEIKEMIEQIRNKYETKILEGENALFLRKNELEGNQNKVLMNKILAEAFRSKCLDPRPTVLPQMQQAVPSSYMQQQHLQHASMQQPTLRPPVGLSSAGQQTPNPACMSMRPPQSIAGFSSAGQPMTVQQTSVQSLQGANHSTALSREYHPPPMSRSIPTATVSSSSPSAASQPLSSLQSIPRSAAPSAVPARPPVINDISPSAGNLRLAGDIRAPAPHLHQFRPTSVSAASPSPLPNAMPGCNVAANVSSSSPSPSFTHVAPKHLTPSPSLPRVAPQVQIRSHSVPRVAPQQQMPSQSAPRVAPQQHMPSQSAPRVAAQHQTPSSSRPWVAPHKQIPSSSRPRVAPLHQTPSSSLPRVAPQQPQIVSSNLSHQKVPAPPQLQPPTVNKNSEPKNRVLTTGNSPLSALLLRDLDSQPCLRPSNYLPPLPEICATFDSIDLSDFGTTGNAAGTSAAEPNAVADVVCLSDDD